MQPTGVIHGEFFPIHTYGKSQCGGNLICDCCIYRMSHNDIENARKNCPHYQKIQLANFELSQYVAILQSSAAAAPPVTCVSFLTPSGLTVSQATASTSITTVASFSKPVFSFPTPNINTTGCSNDILASLCKSYDIVPAPVTPVTTTTAAAVLSTHSTAAAVPVTAAFTNAALPVIAAVPVTPPVTCHPSLVTTTVPVTAVEHTQTRRRHPAGDVAASGDVAALDTTNTVDDILDNSDSSFKELSNILSPSALDVLEDLLKHGGEKKSDDDDGGSVDAGGSVDGG